MFGKIDPKKIQSMMSKMGISQNEIPAKRVIIEQEDKNIIIENPQVMKISMSGNKSFQITGDITESESTEESDEEKEEQKQEDIEKIMEKTGCSKKEAETALENSEGDLAEAILSLS